MVLHGAYTPGTPGGSWSEEDIMITRQRVLEMINPEAWAKEQLYAED